jgi:DNA-binding NtrC family response regulator
MMNRTLSKSGRIAVVDDHGIVRFGYAQLINQEAGLEVCCMAASEQEGLESIRRDRPDLAIIDLSLTEGDGMDLLKSVSAQVPDTKVLLFPLTTKASMRIESWPPARWDSSTNARHPTSWLKGFSRYSMAISSSVKR